MPVLKHKKIMRFRNAMIGMAVLVFLLSSSSACKKEKTKLPVDDKATIARLIQLDKGTIPVEDFFKNPDKTAFCISPDGNSISYLGPYETRQNIFIQSANGKTEAVRVTSETDRDIYNYFWKNNNTLVYIKDSGGDENYKLFAIEKDGSNRRELTPFPNVRIEVIDELRDFPDEIIVAMNKNNPALFEPYRLNIKTGKMEQLAENKDMANPVTTWKVDNKGKLRLAVSVEKGTKTHLLYRDSEDEPFSTILESDWKDMLEPLFFGEQDVMIYALSNLNRDKAALIKLDPKDPDHPTVILEHPDVDVMYAEHSPKKHHLTLAYYATDKKHLVFFDDTLKQAYNKLQKQFPGRDIYFNSYSDDCKKIIVRTFNDISPGSSYLYDTETNAITNLGAINPHINPAAMSEMKPVSFTSRDGIKMNGYLTMPKNAPSKNLPAVILVHGGPMARDYWGYRADVQLLASRGYAVLQINYRGSWGYGKNFAVLGFKQWGRTMQNDITDGVNWLIQNQIADKDRIAIYGSSYGGYAALAGATFTPDLYTCAIDYVGPSNLFMLLNNLPSYWEPEKEMMFEMIGHPVRDSILLHDVSPVFHAENITIPLFIAQGANDPRVNKDESNQLVDALRNRNVEVVYMLKENEGHGFRLEENRLEFYKAMMGFLEEHLGEKDLP